jgi:hypothetical protein
MITLLAIAGLIVSGIKGPIAHEQGDNDGLWLLLFVVCFISVLVGCVKHGGFVLTWLIAPEQDYLRAAFWNWL